MFDSLRMAPSVTVYNELTKGPQVDPKLTQDMYDKVRNDIVKSIEVNDSYFYAHMMFYKNPSINVLDDVYGFTMKLRLVNSQEFSYPFMTNERRTITPKFIVINDTINISDLNNFDYDTIRFLFYKKISEYLTASLMGEIVKLDIKYRK